MEVSKLTISDELLHQKSLKTQVLLWMKEHPKACLNTSCIGLAKTIGLARDFTARTTTASIDQTIRALIRMGLVVSHKINFRRSDFAVNFGHPAMPKEVEEGHEVITTNIKPRNIIKHNAEIVRQNGGTLKEIILEWVKENPNKATNVSLHKLADMIVEDKKLVAKSDSVYTIIGRMVREKLLTKTRGEEDWLFNIKATADAEVKYSPVGGDISKATVAINGGTLADYIVKWVEEHPSELINTNARALAKKMFAERTIKTTFDSLYTQFRKMSIKGDRITREMNDDGTSYTFRLVDPNQAEEPQEIIEERKEEPVEEQIESPIKIEQDGQGLKINITLNINLNR